MTGLCRTIEPFEEPFKNHIFLRADSEGNGGRKIFHNQNVIIKELGRKHKRNKEIRVAKVERASLKRQKNNTDRGRQKSSH